MRIITNERDYYDGYMNYERKDRHNKVWERYEKKIPINKTHLRILENRLIKTYRRNWKAGYLILSGKVIPFVTQHIEGHWNKGYNNYIDTKTVYYFDPLTANKAYTKKVNKRLIIGYRNWWYRTDIKKELVEFFGNYDDMSHLCIECDTPLLLIEPRANYYEERHSSIRTCKTNVNLKELSLSKIYDAPTMYQILNHFVSNVLVNDKMPDTTPMTEKEKLNQHGFDDKYGFKTRKKEKK